MNWREMSQIGARQIPSAQEMLARKFVVDEIHEEIKSLKEKLEDAQKKRSLYLSYTSPFRCLPTEVLSEIAMVYLQDYGDIRTITQVCSRLRDVVLGMAVLWRRIRLERLERRSEPVYDYNPDYGVKCTTVEQLGLILTRAGPALLDLAVEVPAEPGTLELISSRNSRIKDLLISDAGEFGCDTHRFAHLNVESLEQLHFDYLEPEDVGPLMDLALRSKYAQMTLEWVAYEFDLAMFQHALLSRIVDLDIHADEMLPLDASLPVAIPLPNARSCTFSTDCRLLTIFDLNNTEKLDIKHWNEAPNFSMDSIPAQLTEMTLSFLTLTTTMLTQDRPRVLPHLRSLTLTCVKFQGPLQRFLHCPSLKYLKFSSLSIFNSNDPGEEEFAASPVHALCTNAFLKGIPKLGCLSLERMTVERAFVEDLQSCPALESLSLGYSSVEGFIPCFLGSLADVKAFPTLKSLDLGSSRHWPENSGLTCSQFVHHCAVQRPALSIIISY